MIVNVGVCGCVYGVVVSAERGMKLSGETIGAQSMGPRCGGAQGLPVVLPLNSPSARPTESRYSPP